MMRKLSTYDLIGAGYEDIWFENCDARYRVLKGARNTKKSYDFIGYEPIMKILNDPRRNIVMCRQIDKDNRDSTFALLKSSIRRLGLWNKFKCTLSPLQITYLPTGQVILFRGLNDVESITSITVENGYLTDIYIEEASQTKSYDDFRVLDGSLRGELPDGLFLQITFLFNAWDVGSWLYDVFFKDRLEDNIIELEENGYQFYEDPGFNLGYGYGLALHISSYKINEFRASYYDESMEILKETAYEIYKVEGLGCWGNTGERTYSYWNESLIIPPQQANAMSFKYLYVGIDTGYSNGEGKVFKGEDNADKIRAATTMQLVGITQDLTTIVGLDEYFHSNVGLPENEKIKMPQYCNIMCELLVKWMRMYGISLREPFAVYVDCADIGTRDSLEVTAHKMGIYNIHFIGSTKIRIQTRVDFADRLMAFKNILISENCKNLIREIKNAKKTKDGKCREDGNDHAINAWEYAWAVARKEIKMWGDFKEH